MIRVNLCGVVRSSTVTPAPPFGGLHRKARAQSVVWLRNKGLGPGLRRDDGDGFENVDKNTNPSIHVHFQAKMPQTAIQMRSFNP
jgi:hypothetical protein